MAMQRATLEQLRAGTGGTFRLADHDPAWLPEHLRGMKKKARRRAAAEMLEANRRELMASQDILYADGRYSVLLVFQAMDAAGKDGTIKHVMSGVNPQVCRVSSFKVPTAEERRHNYLWRYSKHLPERGMIGIFNRSYFEDVLVVRVHPEALSGRPDPDAEIDERFWQQRYEDINAFERHLARNNTVILKFFLNVSKEEQRNRFLQRLDNPDKNWKFSSADARERHYWDDYMAAFEACISATSTEWAPWWVIPADRKWAMRAAVSDIVTTTIEQLDLQYPRVSDEERQELARARAELLAEG